MFVLSVCAQGNGHTCMDKEENKLLILGKVLNFKKYFG